MSDSLAFNAAVPFNVTNTSFNAIRENKILAKISEFTVQRPNHSSRDQRQNCIIFLCSKLRNRYHLVQRIKNTYHQKKLLSSGNSDRIHGGGGDGLKPTSPPLF